MKTSSIDESRSHLREKRAPIPEPLVSMRSSSLLRRLLGNK